MRTSAQRSPSEQFRRWQFDVDVALHFDEIARTHIPNYENVIGMCADIASFEFQHKDIRIIDVGSAIGHTLETLHARGFTNLYGVDNSPAMLARSRIQNNLILSDTFPSFLAPFSLIMANWTLHFVTDPNRRAAYIQNIFGALSPGGIFILTDKLASSPVVHEQYLDFKRRMGVGEEEIIRKSRSLSGVLHALPSQWYVDTFRECGFTSVEVIDTAYCFTTFLCKR